MKYRIQYRDWKKKHSVDETFYRKNIFSAHTCEPQFNTSHLACVHTKHILVFFIKFHIANNVLWNFSAHIWWSLYNILHNIMYTVLEQASPVLKVIQFIRNTCVGDTPKNVFFFLLPCYKETDNARAVSSQIKWSV